MNDETHQPVFLITGAYGGIGSALARRLAGSGARLVLSGRDEVKLDTLATELGAAGIAADVTVPDDVERLIESAEQVHGRLDGIAHAVGSMLLKPAHLVSVEEFDETLRVNLRSAFLVLKYGVKPLMRSHGSLVYFSTVATGIGLANHEAIAAAKAGIDGMVISAAASYASKGMRINAIAPGLTQTPLASRITSNDAALNASVAMHPLGRIGDPEDIASAAAWLLNPDNSWVTGQILRVDGGLSTVRSR